MRNTENSKQSAARRQSRSANSIIFGALDSDSWICLSK